MKTLMVNTLYYAIIPLVLLCEYTLIIHFLLYILCTGIPVVTEPQTTEPPTVNGTTLLPTNGTTRSPTNLPTNDTTQPPLIETSQPPTVDTTQPPSEDTTEPSTVDTTPPPTENTTHPPTVDTTPPPTENTTQPPPVATTLPPPVATTPPPPVNATQPAAVNTTQPPTENPTSDEIGSGEYCELFVERETDRLQAIARRQGTNFTVEQLRDTVPEECHFLLENEMRTPPTPSQPASNDTAPHSANETTQPPTESPTPEEIGSGEYCEIFVERETDRLQAIARREGTNFTMEQLRDTVPEECHFLIENEEVTMPTVQPTTETPSTAETPITAAPTMGQPVTGQSPTTSPSRKRKRRAQKWSAKSFWHDVSKKVEAQHQGTVNPTRVRFEVERRHMVRDELDDAVFKELPL